MYEIFDPDEPILQNHNLLICDKLQGNDNDCLAALELICNDLLFDTKRYVFSKCSPHVIKLIRTNRNPKVLDNATWCLRTAVEVNSEYVEFLMSSSTIEIITQIFNKQPTKSSVEHTIHILHAMSKYSAIALTNIIDYHQIFEYISDTTNSDIEKRLLSSILLNITQVSTSPLLITCIKPIMNLCSHRDNQIAFNSLYSLINAAKSFDPISVPTELTIFLCNKLMDAKLYKIHNKIIDLLTELSKDPNHAIVIHQQNLDFERLLFSSEFIHSRADFQHVLKLILNFLPYVSNLSVFGLSDHPRPSSNEFNIYEFSKNIQKIMKRVIIEKPLDVKTSLIVYAITIGFVKEETQKRKEMQNSNHLSNILFESNYEDPSIFINDSNFQSDFEDPFYDDGITLHFSDDDNDNNNNKKEENKENNVNKDENQTKETALSVSQNQGENEINEEIDNDLLLALISFSMISSNAPYILAVISNYGNSKKLNECYLLQLIKDFPIQPEFSLWFKQTVRELESKLSKIGTPRPLVNLNNLSLQELNQLALDGKIPSYQFLFGGGVKICKRLLDEESILSDESSPKVDISGIAKLSFSLVSFLPMPYIVNEPSMEDFINLLTNPAPISITSQDGKFKSTVPLIEPIWTLKGLIDMTVNQKESSYLLRLMNKHPKLERFIRTDDIRSHPLSPSNTAVLTKVFENYAQALNNNIAINANSNVHLTNNNNARIGSSVNFLRNSNNGNNGNVSNSHSMNLSNLFSSDVMGLFNINNYFRENDSNSAGFNSNGINNNNLVRRRFGNDSNNSNSNNNNLIRRRINDNVSNDNINFADNQVNNRHNININNRLLRRSVQNNNPDNPINNAIPTHSNIGLSELEKKKYIFTPKPPALVPSSPYPDYKNTSLFSIFCDRAATSADIFKVQPEISLDARPTEMKFESLPNQYFLELFSLLKDLHDNYHIENVENAWKKSEGLSFVSRVHEQFSNPFGSIGRKSYAMTIIFKYSFLFPFEERILAYKLVYLDPYFATRRLISEFKSYDIIALRDHRPEPLKFQVHRDHIFEDGCELLKFFFSHKIEVDVQFRGEKGFGMGPTREFLFNLSREFGRKKYALFRNDSSSNTSDNEYCFSQNGLFPAPNAQYKYFKLLGILVAKAITMECNLELDFNPAFFEIARGKKISVSKVDPIFANSLNCPDGLLESEFTYPGYDSLELKPNGKQLIVNEENVNEYIELVENATVDGIVKKCAEMFVSGFNRILPFSSLDIFSEEEIVSVIRGEKKLITSNDLSKYCQLDGGYTNESPEIQMLYQFVDQMNSSEQKDFFKFVTGSSNLPIGGLKVLEPKMTIVKRNSTSANAIINPDQELPTSNTCNCTLKLPTYSSIDVLAKQFKFAFSYGNTEFGRS